jgi:predicted membrane protein
MNKKLIRVGVIAIILSVFLVVISTIADIYLGYEFHPIYNIITLVFALFDIVFVIIYIIYHVIIAIKSIKQDTISEIEDYDLIKNKDKQDLNNEGEKKSGKNQYGCPKCGSCNLKRYGYGYSDKFYCMDCGYAGPPFIPDV